MSDGNPHLDLRRALLALLAAVLLLPLAAGPAAAQLPGPNPWLARRPLNLAHRGGAVEWPENTMFAYRQALATGADMIEADVYESADGELVVIHDDSVDRTTNGTGSVSAQTLAQLRALDAGFRYAQGVGSTRSAPESAYVYRGVATGQRPPPPGARAEDFRIPTLREVLTAFPGVLLIVELKPDPDSTGTYERKLAALLREFRRADDVYVASFLDPNVALFSAAAPEVSTSPGTAGVAEFVAASRGPAPGHPIPHDVLAVPPGQGGLEIVSADFVADAHANALAVHVFTINDCPTMVRLLDLGVDAIYTDRPSLLEAVLAQPAATRSCAALDAPAAVVPEAPAPLLLLLVAVGLALAVRRRRLIAARP